MLIPPFLRALCESPDKTDPKRFYFFAALAIFAALAVYFYFPFWTDLRIYGFDDWDESNFLHAVPVWTVKYFHEFPLWNPYLMGGSSLIGNPQNPSPLSLTFLLSLLVGPLAGIKLGNALNALLGMTGMYVLMGYFNTIWIARVLAAVVFALNGMVVHHASEGNFMCMMPMYWPYMLLFFLKAFDNRLWAYLSGLMLSLQIWGGGPYSISFAVVILGILSILFALRDKKARYLLRFVEMIGAFVVFSGPKLFMMMETLYKFPRVTINEDAHVPWSVFYYAFFCRDQISNHIPNLKVDEFSAYVGFIPFVLAGVLFFQWKKYWPYLCVLLFSLGMALGNSPYSPFWPIFHFLGAGYFHVSTRSFLISVFFIAMASGLSLSYLVLRWREKYPIFILIACAVVIIVIFDLVAVLSPIRKFTITNARQYQDFQPSIPFSQIETTQKQRYRFGNSSMLDLLLRNTGTVNGYDPVPFQSHVTPKNSPNYKGEFFLQHGFGDEEIAAWSPNHWDVKLQLWQKDILIVNQNFDPGWRTNPPRKVLNVGGVLGVEVTPEDKEIIFYYLPFNFILGCWVSVLGLVAMGWDVRRRKVESIS